MSDYYNSMLRDKLLADQSRFKDVHQLTIRDKEKMSGYVYCIHETKNGHKELVSDDHNHIVLVGRKWLMQRAVGSSLDENNQCNWFINWFGLGCGGANTSDPLNPLYTPDNQLDLANPIKIHNNNYYEGYTYTNDEYKKTFKKYNNTNAQLKYDPTTNEVVALFHLIVEYKDCPYEAPKLGVTINEMALYASPTQNSNEENFVMFSRYCMPSKYKSYTDKYYFLWFIYF